MRSLLLPLLLVAFAFAPSPASADQVDQEFTGPGVDASVSVDEVFPRAQTFTAGATGILTRIALSIARGGTSLDTDTITIDVRPTDASGAPLVDDGSALASVTFDATHFGGVLDPGALFEIDLASFAIEIAPGDRLAIVARAPVPFFGGRAFALGARVVTGEGHPGGAAWYRPSPEAWQLQPGVEGGVDLVFRTWVPEPGAALSAAAAIAALALRRKLSAS